MSVRLKVCVHVCVSSGCVDPIMSLVEQRVGADGSRREPPSATASVLGYASRSLNTSPAIYRVVLTTILVIFDGHEHNRVINVG